MRKFAIGEEVVCVAKTTMAYQSGKRGTVRSYGKRIYWVDLEGRTVPQDFYACELVSAFKPSDIQPDKDWS